VSVTVSIVNGALAPAAPTGADGAGAVVLFEGVVRPQEDGAPIEALDYEAYQPMAERMLARIADDLVERFGLIEMRIEHSRGRVGVGERSFRLVVCAPHRKEALQTMDEFIDRMKRDVPIWKRPVHAHAAESSPAAPASRGG